MAELSQLKWQCRRGVKELDVLLSDYLEHHYPHSSESEQRAFQALLQYEDPILWCLLTGDTCCDDIKQQQLIKKLMYE
ncbi:MAG: succinate dehydrogenase assembly factor 2 [Cocleimonas sp.]|nr:succinate dehydrogenase assembly factor 2 [Cocleimonas sp.]